MGFVRSLGITTIVEEDNNAQTGVIGGLKYGVTVEELTNAYAAIANQGVFNDAYMIKEIRDANNEIVYKHKSDPQRVVSEQSAYLMTDMLRTVITDGTAVTLQNKFKNYGKIPIAGKTGTTQNYGDVWFQGFTPDVTLGVWAGHEKVIHTLKTKEAQGRARSIWAEIMNSVTEAKPELFPTKEFHKPDGIVSMTVSSVSGKLPTELTRASGKLVTDIFNAKFVPKEPDDALVKVKYISYNGVNYLPQPGTPEDLLRESIMIVRETPLDTLIEELKSVLGKVKTAKPLSYYLPKDAAQSAPSKIDPRQDDGSAPNPPGHIAVETVNGKVRVSFTPAGQADIAGYRLYRAVDGGSYNKVEASVPTGQEPKFVNYISSGQSYSYYVTSVDVAGNESAPSEITSTNGLPAEPDPGFPNGGDPNGGDNGSGQPDSVVSVPNAPVGLTVRASDIGASLSWRANSSQEGVTQYQVWFSAAQQGNYTLLGTTDTPDFEYVDTLTSGWYQVTAVNANGESEPSAAVKLN
ncbi:penicillin-binding transpeptidase domain-containing protein [Cohnella kolymensis]|uniref:penicillin-binding transpeptidase domain-containing protein n=1 Tax=Cohnella kolymensis TaxID=1590652 RepID=UPI002E0D0F5D